MKTDLFAILEVACVAGAIALVGCSSAAPTTPGGQAGCPTAYDAGCPGKDAGCPGKDAGCPGKDAGCPASDAGCPGKDAGYPAYTPGTAEIPPTGNAAEITAWLKKGDYKAWKCEAAAHEPRAPSPHGKNRICSNAKSSAHTTGEYPIGAANVKELFDAAGTNVTGYAIEYKTAAGKGDAWYWFEQMGANVVADGPGSTPGTVKNVCVGCHASAGSGAGYSGHDFVYTQVK
jgi:hypothetical protein